MKGYKVFLPNFTSNEGKMQYAENQIFEVPLPIQICQNGLHFCTKAQHCFNYYSFDPNNVVCEAEALGEVQVHSEDSKACTNILKVGRRLTWQEVLVVANDGINNTGHSNSGDQNSGYRNSGNWNSGNWNSGNRNSGYRNSGNWNSGDQNSGYRNSGDQNSGYRNSGNWNSGNRNSGDQNSGYRNSGAFCLDNDPKLYLFDKATKMTVRQWEQSKAVNIMNRLLETTMWVYASSMTTEEKQMYPKYETTEGYLKTKSLKEAWKDMWGNLSEENKKEFTTLENFDADKFFEITGVRV